MKITSTRIKGLVAEYGTPMYLYDKQELVSNLQHYHDCFKSSQFDTQVLYASKAFSVKRMYELVQAAKLGVDVVSYGELVTAIKAKVDPQTIYFHGNNKSVAEITYALKHNIYCFIADNLDELVDIENLCHKYNKKCNIMLRMNVGVEAHTHRYIVTSHIDSKTNYSKLAIKVCDRHTGVGADGLIAVKTNPTKAISLKSWWWFWN